MTARIIQFPAQHGPITREVHAVRCVQEAAMRALGRTLAPDVAQRFAALLESRAQRKASEASGTAVVPEGDH